MDEGGWYWIGYRITWVLTFIACWIYAVASYGFLLGVGLGWLPSAIVATIFSFLWPLIVLAIVGVVLLVAAAASK